MYIKNFTNTVNSKLLSIIRSNYLAHKIASQSYIKYDNLKNKRAFDTRINSLNPHDYFNASCKPDLNVILLVIDSLRNTRLSSKGYFRETTPFMDTFESKLNAISAAPWTYPSVASILTGLYPHNHNAFTTGKLKSLDDLRNLQPVKNDILTLPEMLHLLGYRTYFGTAIDTAFYPLRARVNPKRYYPTTRASTLLNDVSKWTSKGDGHFFAYIHFADLHQPLNPPKEFTSFFGKARSLPNIHTWDFTTLEQQDADPEKFDEYRYNRQLIYDNVLRSVDHAIERFYKSLNDRGLVDSTVIVVTADHGDEFWEHADMEAKHFFHQKSCYGTGHGHNFFNEIIEVPLLWSGPIPNITCTNYVSTVDIFPTIVDLLRIDHNINFDGQSIYAPEAERPLLSEASGGGYEKKALILGRYKLIYSKDDGVEWVFNLKNDPHEQQPIVDKQVTSAFVEKLSLMLREGERMKIRQIMKKQL